MDIFSPINIAVFLIDIAMAIHIVRTGRSMLWLVAMAITSFIGSLGILVLVGLWLAYLVTAVIPDFLGSNKIRRLRTGLREAADPGARLSREKAAGGAGGLGGFQARFGRGKPQARPSWRSDRAL